MSTNTVAERLMKLSLDARENVAMNATISDTVSKILSEVDSPEVELRVNKVWVNKKYDNSDIKSQRDVRNSGKIWADELRANLDLVDKITGEVIDSSPDMRIATIPKITDRTSYIIGGNEYQFTKQARLRPGVYTKHQSNGEISSFFNVDKSIDFDRGFNNNFKLTFKPDKQVFMMNYGTNNVPLINALRAIGVTDEEISNSWGSDVFAANDKEYGSKQSINQNKLYGAIFGRAPESSKGEDEVRKAIKDRLFSTELDPETTKITLGKEYSHVDKGSLLDASKKIIDINRGAVKEDDREALIFKSFYGPEDHIRERLVKSKDKIVSSIRHKIGKTRQINKSMSSQTFDPFIAGTLTTSQLSNPPSQINPMAIIGEDLKFTLVGEGGIGSANAITKDIRTISNSEVGFVDPMHTPEGGSIGVALHLTKGAVKVGTDLYGQFRNQKTGKSEMVKPMDLWYKNVGFPDEYSQDGKAKKKTVRVIREGEFHEVSEKEVDYVIPDAQRMFDVSANSIPFIDSIQANRGLTASKMQEQALPLVSRDKPLFKINTSGGQSMGDMVGGMIASPKAKASGEIISITPDEIVLRDGKGVEHTHGLYNNYSLNAESFLNNEATVNVGDKVRAGQTLADNNFTKDGTLALGANLNVAYMPYRGYNFEDSTIISESAARKLTSEHMYDFKARRTSAGVFSKSKLKAYYPELLTAANGSKLDSDGVITVGKEVSKGDVLIAHLERKAPSADDIAVGKLDKQLKRDMANVSQVWDKDVKGIVTEVKKSGNNIVVNVKTKEPLKVADKISGLHGNKHIVSKIVPDEDMPFNPSTGERIDITMSPLGVSGRINTSQLLENAAGKLAKHTGKQYSIDSFADVDNSRKIMEELTAAGLSDKDILIDPENGKPFMNPVANGVSHIMKLEHTVDHKYSARYRETYDSNEQPSSGGHHGGKNVGRMETSALLARNAPETLREIFGLKGQRNDEFWRAMEMGNTLPPPKDSFVWDKMRAMMRGAGINVEQNGKSLKLRPLTDEDIISSSKGEILDPTMTYRKKDLAPIKGGLFDPVRAGGIHGDSFTHFKLPEKVLNPITSDAAASILNMSTKHMEEIIEGKSFIDKKTLKEITPGEDGTIALSGGPAIEAMLSRVNVDDELKSAEAQAEVSKNPADLNKLHKKIRNLRSLKESGMKPTDYMVSNVQVIPSKFRPMFTMGGSDGAVIMSDINDLYQQAGYTSETMKELQKELKSSIKDETLLNTMLAESRGELYKDLKAIVGTGDPTSYLHKIKNKKGFIKQIDGGEKQSKYGFFQDKVLERRQDLVGRSTIILNPDLSIDEIGIPEDMATEMFQPFIMKEIVGMGYSPLEAKKQIEEESEVFKRARDIVAKSRPVIANRAPTLHRWNMTAFKPVLTKGKSIEVSGNVVTSNFGGDFDGDTFQMHTPVSAKAVKEAWDMLPSKNMIKEGWDSILNAPSMDVSTGVYLAVRGDGGVNIKESISSVSEAVKGVSDGKYEHSDIVSISGRKATIAQHQLNEHIPSDLQNWDRNLSKSDANKWLLRVTKGVSGKAAADLADTMSKIGNAHSTRFGYTLGVSDTISNKEIKDRVLQIAEGKIRDSKNKRDPFLIPMAYAEAKEEGLKMLEKEYGDKSMIGIGIVSGGGKGIGNTSAISLMPGVVSDSNDNPIPIPITRSYSEGLDTFGYWAAAHGARTGNIMKSVQSSAPGYFTKDLTTSMYETRINSDSPVDYDGIEYSTSDSKGLMNRYLAKDVVDKNGEVIAKSDDLIDGDTINKIRRAGVKNIFVQSPLTDPTPGDGFSSYSYGADYNGKRKNFGDNIGIMSSHTITEPSLNLAMKSFHTGGAFSGRRGPKVGTAFDAMNRLFRFTDNLPDKATVSDMDGAVSNIEESSVGGWNVTIDDGKNKSIKYVDSVLDVKVKKGDSVKKGDMLSTGTASPHDILKFKGVRETQKYLVDKISEINSGGLDKRDIETLVRSVTNTTRIKNSGGFKDYVPGDIAPLTTVEWANNHNIADVAPSDAIGDTLNQSYGKHASGTVITDEIATDLSSVKSVSIKRKQIEHEPFLISGGIGDKSKVSTDWLARLGHNRLESVLKDGTTMGWESDVSGEVNPLPQLISGNFRL